jgi:hypothetical protein
MSFAEIYFYFILIEALQNKTHSFVKKSFSAKFFFCILEKEILAGKNLLCKRGFSLENYRLDIERSFFFLSILKSTPTIKREFI